MQQANWNGDNLNETVARDIEAAIPDSKVEVTNQGSHFHVIVVSPAFEGKKLLAKQRMVYDVLGPYMSGPNAPIHAVDTLKTLVPDA